VSRSKAFTIREAVKLYMDGRRGEVGRSTRRHMDYTLTQFAETVGEGLPINEVRPRHLNRWRVECCAHLSPNTARVKVGTVKVFFRWLYEQRRITADPAVTLRAPKVPRSLPRELDREAVERALAACPDARARAVVNLMLMEGLRRSEVAGLTMPDIDWYGRTLRIIGKGGHERFVPLSHTTRDALMAYLSEHPDRGAYLIRGYTNDDGLAPGTVGGLVTAILRGAGVKQRAHDGVSGHAFRHTAAGAMLDHDADIREVSDFLGHTSIAVTAIYLKRRVATQRLRAVMDERDPDPRPDAPRMPSGPAQRA
jgi:integrase/recombinase XerC